MKIKDSIFSFLFAGVGYMLFCSAVPSVVAEIMSSILGGHVNDYYALLSFGASVLFMVFLYRYFREKAELFTNVSGKGIIEALVIGLVMFIVVNFIVSPVLGAVFTTSEANYVENVKQMFETPFATFIQLVVIAPAMEELVFRGFLLKRELRYRPTVIAVVCVAVWFGILHMNVVQGISAAAAGFILCEFYVRRRSVGLNILTHAFYNGLAYFLMYFFGGVR